MTANTNHGLNPRAELLRVHTMQRLCATIADYEGVVTGARRRGLDHAAAWVCDQALGIDPGRYAYGLPCGAGKTQLVVALIAAAHELGYGLTFAVAANTIRALALIKRDLMRAGVPEAWIGLRHSKTASQLADELEGEDVPPGAMVDTGDDDRPIMLVSHAHIRGRNSALFSRHGGRSRSLLIWDETLLTADAAALLNEHLALAVQYVCSKLPNVPALRSFLSSALDKVKAELDAQGKGALPALLEIAEGHDLPTVSSELDTLPVYGDPAMPEMIRRLRALVALAERPTSVFAGNDKEKAIIHYAVAVDHAWSNIAILDASHSIRLLAQQGGVIDRTTDEMRNCRLYEDVVVNLYRMAASKSAQREDGAAARLAASIVSGIAMSEGILLVGFKDKAAMARLKRALADAGVDLSAKLPNGKRRVSFLTWGRETSTNAYRHCEHVVILGIFRHNKAALAALFAGEIDNPLARPGADVMRSEIAHVVLQALHRGACRTTDANGQAGAMTAHIIDSDVSVVRDLLAAAMPGASWETTTPHGKLESVTEKASKAVSEILDKLPETTLRISSDKLKPDAAAAIGVSLGKDGWKVAIDCACKPGSGWRRERRGVARCSTADDFDLRVLDLSGVRPAYRVR